MILQLLCLFCVAGWTAQSGFTSLLPAVIVVKGTIKNIHPSLTDRTKKNSTTYILRHKVHHVQFPARWHRIDGIQTSVLRLVTI